MTQLIMAILAMFFLLLGLLATDSDISLYSGLILSNIWAAASIIYNRIAE